MVLEDECVIWYTRARLRVYILAHIQPWIFICARKVKLRIFTQTHIVAEGETVETADTGTHGYYFKAVVICRLGTVESQHKGKS